MSNPGGKAMTPEQKDLVRTTWRMIEPIADTAANMFYTKLFELDPTLRPLFKPDMSEQKRRLTQTLGFAVASLYSLDSLVPVIQQLGKRHVGYGIDPSHYETVAAALMWTLKQGLGISFTPAVEEAWIAVYVTLTDIMKGATKDGMPNRRVAA
jgi:hemoglobin-like flavoprotein